MPRPHTPFTTIRTEGALLPADLLQRIVEADADLGGLTSESYHLSGEKLNEAINRSWNRLLGAWAAFSALRAKLPESDLGTSVTREKWLLPLCQELGYGRLVSAKAIELEGKSYPISHGWNEVPLHLVGCNVNLDKRTAGAAGAARSSPHSLVQELLNRDANRLWGFVSNGLRWRVLRDNASLTRQAFLEFDLEAMMSGEVYADFAVLWLVCHQSRVEGKESHRKDAESAKESIEEEKNLASLAPSRLSSECWLEKWSKAAQARGTRALETLRTGVEAAIAALGRGFLSHKANAALRDKLRTGNLSAQDYYRQLLRLVYRLIFLFVAEDRGLLFDPKAPLAGRERYARYYSTSRLRRLAERLRGSRHADLYKGLGLVMAKLGNGGAPELSLPALGGFLFSSEAVRDLNQAELANADLLAAIRSLALTVEGKTRRAVDYKNLGPEELGSVYESLLELHPLINSDSGSFELRAASGSERKTSGSYYTPSSLIQCLLESALDPVIESTVQKSDPAAALLALKVCDPACGSGHFLLAAAHRLAKRLASIRTGDEEPAPEALRAALREVIGHCIYGVDINPMSVELCKVSLWMEALEPGKPLSFLDQHIQCGNSLMGATPALLARGIPDEAFTPIEGDDKTVCSEFKKRNKKEREGQLSLFGADMQPWDKLGDLAASVLHLEQVDDSTIEGVRRKQAEYEALVRSNAYEYGRLWADAWCAAFVWKKTREFAYPITEEVFRKIERNPFDVATWMRDEIKRLAGQYQFFHWHLAFPEVFTPASNLDKATAETDVMGWIGGFDCVLGNPPWETLQLEEQEFFATRDPQIASLPKNLRKKAIVELVKSNPVLARTFEDAKHMSDANNKFLRVSNRFELSATGKLNTYALFAEQFRNLLSIEGFGGIILPTGIATDDSTKQFFGDLLQKQSLVRLIGFENESLIFPAVHHSFKFCVLTMVGLSKQIKSPKLMFFCRRFEDVRSTQRIFTLTVSDFALVNPNSGTTPIFRTKTDADLNRKIYQKVTVLMNEYTTQNEWQIRLKQGLFNMTSDSNLFKTEKRNGDLPLYEAKMIDHYDHRYGTYEGATQAHLNLGNLPQTTEQQKQNPAFLIVPRYWVISNSVMERLEGWNRKWLIGFRDVTSSISERTSIFSLLPIAGVGHTMPLVFFQEGFDVKVIACFLANMNTFAFDYLARQKVSGLHLTFTVLKQLPVLPPSAYTSAAIDFIAPRVLGLVYTAYDLKPFAEDMGYHGEPFKWDEERRALLRAELDAYYAKLYGLTRDELRYILDPKEVYGEDFPGETFRVLKDKELRLYGEYRTRRLVLEAWDGMGG